MTRPHFRLPAALLLVLLALTACGEKEEPRAGATGGALESFTLVLDYFPNADHAGIYAAQAAGEYRKAGLDLKIRTPPDPAAPLKLLAAGRADLAISYEPELLLARDGGARDLVSVGALVQKPLTSIISLGGANAVRAPRDLAGKRIGTSGIPYQAAYLRTILEAGGVEAESVKETNVGFNLTPALISKRVDATLGSFWNYEGVDLQRRRRNPVILRMEDVGIPTYAELIFVGRTDRFDERGASKVRRFLQATARGHRALREDPAAGTEALLEANRDLDRGLQQAVVRATLPVFFPADDELPFGYQSTDEWAAYGDWMRRNELLKQPPNAARALTNEFLPGQGLEPSG